MSREVPELSFLTVQAEIDRNLRLNHTAKRLFWATAPITVINWVANANIPQSSATGVAFVDTIEVVAGSVAIVSALLMGHSYNTVGMYENKLQVESDAQWEDIRRSYPELS